MIEEKNNKMQESERSKKKKIERRLFEISVKAVIFKDGKVLILRRSGDSIRDAGKLDLPGGAVEHGEKIKEGLAREIKEEIGIKIEVGPVVYLSDYEKEYALDKEKQKTIQIYGKGIGILVFYKSGEVKLSDEHEDYEWLDIETAINKFNEKDNFEVGKKQALIEASRYLQMQNFSDGRRK
ncbi:MAG: NUDIX domain-containing protein [Candidatus Moranbacteria bacterium]|nr:NUDIX domain-containing protein [Candidatus Moranbacteria bacterium]